MDLDNPVALELDQRLYEGALVPDHLRQEIAVLIDSEASPASAKARVLLEQLAALEPDPGFPYIQPNELDAIRDVRPDGPRQLNFDASDSELRDHFYGAWIGRACGCALGKPVEMLGILGTRELSGRAAIRAYLENRGHWPLDFYFSGASASDDIELESPNSQREQVSYMEPDDDIHYTLMALHILETRGPDFAWYDVADTWNRCLPYAAIFTAEAQAILSYNATRHLLVSCHDGCSLGDATPIRPTPAFTRTNVNPYREWIGAQIRADGWGYACAGNPELAAEFAWRDAHWTHTANGIYGEMFFAALIAGAFVERDAIRLIKIGLSEIPRKCRFAEAVRVALAWFEECPTAEDFMDRLDAWFGHLHPVHTVNNALIVLMALYYGEMGLHKSVCLAVMAGLDTDCNGATAGSIVGAAVGYEHLDSPLIEPLHDTIKPMVFGFPDITMRELSERQLEVFKRLQDSVQTQLEQ